MFGGRRVEGLLLKVLQWHYQNRFRRGLALECQPPRFLKPRIGAFDLT